MKIAILGTKGIPNNYGGFEQFAEYLSIALVSRGHEVTVYNPSFHPYTGQEYSGVRIKTIYSPEKLIGGAANFLYDHLCLKDALRQDFDIIYEAGYHSVALSFKVLNIRQYKRPVVITNMDGLEWKRSKWSFWTQSLIRKLETIAVKESPYLISDNMGIRQYYLDQFNRDSFFIPYGADPVYEFNSQTLLKYQVQQGNYFMLIARMEPENNIELVLDGYMQSGHPSPFLVVGNYSNGFGQTMYKKFSSTVRFIGAVYDKKELDALRHFSKAYLHGHSVGGTNPSLLEAMSCRSFIMSHDNAFNRGVLGDEAIYFSTAGQLALQFKGIDDLVLKDGSIFTQNNFDKIVNLYNWEKITGLHENLFSDLLLKNQGR